jgi:hypothetical protein
VWTAGAHKSVKDDLVMAMWFAELRAGELMSMVTRADQFDRSSEWFVPRFDSSRRFVVDALDAEMSAPPADVWGGGGF